MARLDFKLHPGQLQVFEDPSRFKVIAAGRRWGKSYLSAVEMITKVMETKKRVGTHDRSLADKEVWYIAPTLDQGRDIIWHMLKQMAGKIIRKTWENDSTIEFINGRRIQVKGSDRPDRLKGVGLSHVVLDEFADMKPDTWQSMLRPTLADVQGTATFIGTPAVYQPKNHFYELWQWAKEGGQAARQWAAWSFETISNPYLPREEVEEARATLPLDVFKREFQASFESPGKMIFPYELQVIAPDEVPRDGTTVMAIDPGGFLSDEQMRLRGKRAKHLDDTAIAIVKVTPHGWFVVDVQAGRWPVRETSIRILNECRTHHPVRVAIEKGIARNALMPYIQDQCRRLGVFPNFIEVSHGGKDKTSRVAWALQGRMEHGKIYFARGDYLRKLEEQIHDFPGGRHDDMVDALAYIDQVSQVVYRDSFIEDTWNPLDEAIGL